jgi:hypothetical protein
MTKDDLIRMADLAGYDVDEDDVHAPASGRFGIDPRLVHFAQLVADSMLIRQKAKYYQEGYEAGQRDEREICAKICEEFVLGDPHAAAIRERNKT